MVGKKLEKATPELLGSSQRSENLAVIDQLCQSYLAKHPTSPAKNDHSLLSQIQKFVAGKRKKWNIWRIFVLIGLIISALSSAWLFLPPNVTVATFRLALLQVLPFWNWTHLRDVPCLLRRPEVATDGLNGTTSVADSCMVCEDLEDIFERPGGTLTALQVGEDFLVEELPLILRHVFHVDPDGPKLQLRNILALHLEDESLDPCKFRTNLRTKSAFRFDAFLRKVKRDDLQIPWFAFWEMCQHHHIKECRVIIPRPPELPSMLEIADSFWFFAASNFTAIKYKFIDLSFSVFWFTQMSGTSKIRLDPKPTCQSVCHIMEAELRPGDALLMTTDLFEVSWMPGPEEEVLALAAGAQ